MQQLKISTEVFWRVFPRGSRVNDESNILFHKIVTFFNKADN